MLVDCQANYNSLFTPPTRTRQNCLVLSSPCRRCEHTWRQDKTVLSRLDPVSKFATVQSQIILRITEDLEIGNWVETRQNCLTVRTNCAQKASRAGLICRTYQPPTTPPVTAKQRVIVFSCAYLLVSSFYILHVF